jgi:hypothetical protein
VDCGIGFKTEWEVVLTDAKTGRVKQHLTYESNKNCIVDEGLNYRLTNVNKFAYDSVNYMIFPYITLGTGNASPTTTDTKATFTGRIEKQCISAHCSYNTTTNPSAPYVVLGTQWGTSEGNGTWAEVGLCTSGTSGKLWSRNLFKDGSGNPTAVTKTSADILTVKAKITITRSSETPYEATIDGRTLKGIILNEGLSAAITDGWWGPNYGMFTAGTNNTVPSATQTALLGSSLGSSDNGVWSDAVTGPPSFYRECVTTILTSQCNGNISEVITHGVSTSKTLRSRHTFDPALPKTSSWQLQITHRITLSRV